LRELHDELLAALAVQELDRFGDLLGTRANLIADLQEAWRVATPDERVGASGAVAELQRLDAELRSCSQRLHDDLADQLSAGSTRAPRPVQNALTGVLDRRA
jgi:hypothetical protein